MCPRSMEPEKGWRLFGWESAALLVAFLGVALALYEPVMEGEFLSDDLVVISGNPYVQELTLGNLVEILDPYGPAVRMALNYAPVHLLSHAVEVHLFGDAMRGYHLVNVLVHAVVAWLFVMLLMSSQLPGRIAAAAGMLFLVHPANVEAVAMVFQLKTVLAAAFAFGALLAFWRHPLLATLLFGLALLTKFSALFALPVAGVLVWVRSADPQREVPNSGWLAVWAVVFLLVAIPEFGAFQRVGQGMQGDALVQVRSIVAFAMRYLVNAATSIGIGPFQQPERAYSWGDPWFLMGTLALTLLAWRTGWTLYRREEEAAWWVMAAASFAPVSQVFPFIYPMSDRYLYTILPGLLGGTLLASCAAAARIEPWLRGRVGIRAPVAPLARMATAAAILGLALALAPRAHDHTRVFQNANSISSKAAQNYPDGIQAWVFRATRSARQRDAAAVATALHELEQRQFYSYVLMTELVKPVRSDPRVREALASMTRKVVERLEGIEDPFPGELRELAQAQLELGRVPEAIESLERALQIGSRRDDQLRVLLQKAQAQLAQQQEAPAVEAPQSPGSM